jgi:hypothetical protein
VIPFGDNGKVACDPRTYAQLILDRPARLEAALVGHASQFPRNDPWQVEMLSRNT